MSKKEKRTVLVGIGEWIVDERDAIAEKELEIMLEQAPFWNDDYQTLIQLLKHGDTQMNIAQALNTTQSTVSRMIKRIRKYVMDNM